ncbi:hypothetical protein FQZ97_989210 [compost metagenome]
MPSSSTPPPVFTASSRPAGTRNSSRALARSAVSRSLTTPLWINREPPVKGKMPWVLAASAPLRASCRSLSTLPAAWASTASAVAPSASGASKPQPKAAAVAVPRAQATTVSSRKAGRVMRTSRPRRASRVGGGVGASLIQGPVCTGGPGTEGVRWSGRLGRVA